MGVLSLSQLPWLKAVVTRFLAEQTSKATTLLFNTGQSKGADFMRKQLELLASFFTYTAPCL